MRVLDRGKDYKEEVQLDGETLFQRLTQDDRPVIEQNLAIQNQGGIPANSWSQPVLNMPMLAWIKLTQRFPDLVRGDAATRKQLIGKISRMPEYRQYVISSKPKFFEVRS